MPWHDDAFISRYLSAAVDFELYAHISFGCGRNSGLKLAVSHASHTIVKVVIISRMSYDLAQLRHRKKVVESRCSSKMLLMRHDYGEPLVAVSDITRFGLFALYDKGQQPCIVDGREKAI